MPSSSRNELAGWCSMALSTSIRPPRSARWMASNAALDHFASWCAEMQCRLGSQRDDVLSLIKNFLDQLDQQPLAVSGGRTLSQQQGVEAVFYSMYGGRASWPVLARCARGGDVRPRRQLACCSSLMPRIGAIAMAATGSSTMPSPRSAVSTAETTACVPQRSGLPRTPAVRQFWARLNGPDLTMSALAGQICAQAAEG